MRRIRSIVAITLLAAVASVSAVTDAWAQYRRSAPATGPYRPGPTHDQTSRFGLSVNAGVMERDIEERIGGDRFVFDVESTRLLVEASVRPLRPFQIYGLVGVADLDSPFEDADFDGDFGFAYGGGVRVTLFRSPRYDTTVFLDGRYLQFESDASGVPFFDPGLGDIVFLDQTMKWREWEGRAGVSWRFYLTRPYLGLRYSDAEAERRVAGTELTLPARDNVGGFVGTDIYFDPDRRVGLTLDLSFPDQVTFTAGLRVWF